MENLKLKNPESIKCDKDFILRNLKLVADNESESKGFLKLESDLLVDNINTQRLEKAPLDNPEQLFRYFEGIKTVEPDQICRPKGDTTFFTSAGVQHIETILREKNDLEKEQFAITQPVIRSQFMDKVKDGTSTSFVNFSVESIASSPDEFVGLSDKLINLVVDRGVDPAELKFQIEDVTDRWGDRKFTKTVLTLYFKGIELGECVYIHDYPVKENEKISISDISFGVERFNWGIGSSKNYFPGFDKVYTEATDSNKITSVIDCIRTAVLMAGEGISPSHRDPGYRLRQLSKRFTSRNQGINIDVTELIHSSYEYWKRWGFKPGVSEDDVMKIIKLENDRSYNVLFLSMLEKSGGPRIHIDVNQTTKNFLNQIDSFPLLKETKKLINELIEKLK